MKTILSLLAALATYIIAFFIVSLFYKGQVSSFGFCIAVIPAIIVWIQVKKRLQNKKKSE